MSAVRCYDERGITGSVYLDTLPAIVRFDKGLGAAYFGAACFMVRMNINTKNPLGQSILTIKFEDDRELLDLIGLDDDDRWFLNAINSYWCLRYLFMIMNPMANIG